MEDDEKRDAVLQRAINKIEAGSARVSTEGEGDVNVEEREDSELRTEGRIDATFMCENGL